MSLLVPGATLGHCWRRNTSRPTTAAGRPMGRRGQWAVKSTDQPERARAVLRVLAVSPRRRTCGPVDRHRAGEDRIWGSLAGRPPRSLAGGELAS